MKRYPIANIKGNNLYKIVTHLLVRYLYLVDLVDL